MLLRFSDPRRSRCRQWLGSLESQLKPLKTSLHAFILMDLTMLLMILAPSPACKVDEKNDYPGSEDRFTGDVKVDLQAADPTQLTKIGSYKNASSCALHLFNLQRSDFSILLMMMLASDVDQHTTGASIAYIIYQVAQWDVMHDAEFATSLCSFYFSVNLFGLLCRIALVSAFCCSWTPCFDTSVEHRRIY
ncbi:hypothetical protein Cgig2_003972 [Carnegiea gigantea]|uniref:Uncharacterized protein n=1 Tax=Carnegiea gigantea TaxID=171969 RepID=A0A9Q1QFQ8_9CARY|nr:hypothetical protein Cgig2_003972 [Carnegiea gigantea]